MKFKNFNCDETLNSNCDKTQKLIVMYLKNLNCDEIKKNQIVIKLKTNNFDETKNSNCDETKNSNCDETQKVEW